MKKRMKQFFAVLLSVVLMFSGLYVTDSKVQAAEQVTAEISLSKNQVKPGDIITVEVGVKNVSAVSPKALEAIKLNVTFDPNKFEFVKEEGDDTENANESFKDYLPTSKNTTVAGTYSTGSALYQYADAKNPVKSDTKVFSFQVKAKDTLKDSNIIFNVIGSYQTLYDNKAGAPSEEMQSGRSSVDILAEGPSINLNGAPNTGKGYGNDVVVSINKGTAKVIDNVSKKEYDVTPDKSYTVTENGSYTVKATDSVGNESSTTFNKTGVKSISVSKNPTKESYVEGYDGAIDSKGGELTVNFTDGTSNVVPLADAILTYDKSKMSKLGFQTITVTYGKFTTTFQINIVKKSVTEISVNKAPTKTEYPEGTNILLDGGVLNVSYDNGKSETVSMTEATVSGYDNTKVGEQTITLKYEGKETSLKITVVKKKVISLSVNAPSDLTVTEGAARTGLDLSKVKATVKYDNGTSETIAVSSSMVTYEENVVGKQTAKVEFGGQTATFDLQVIAKVATGIKMKTQPEKTTYKEGDVFSVAGATIVVAYNNNTESAPIQVTKNMLKSTPSMTNYGVKQSVTVGYTDSSTSKSFETSFDYIVNEKQLSEINVKAPSKTIYIEKNEFLVQGGKITLKFDNGVTQEVDLSPGDCTGFDMSKVGEQTVTVSYKVKNVTKTTQFTINVKAKTISSITVKKQPSSSTVLEGKSLSLAGGILAVSFDNGETADVDMDQASVSGFDNNKVEAQTVTLTYGNKSATIDVTVKPKTLTSISLTKNAEISEYFVGDKISYEGLEVVASYDNDSTAIVTDKVEYTAPEFTLEEGQHSVKKTVTVSYTQGSLKKSTGFVVTIVSKADVDALNATTNKLNGIDIKKLDLEGKANLADRILAALDSYNQLSTDLEKTTANDDFVKLNTLLYRQKYSDKDSDTGISFAAGAGIVRIDAKVVAKKTQSFTFDSQNSNEKYDVLDSFLFSSIRVTDDSDIQLGTGSEGLKITIPMSDKVKEVYSSLLPNEKLIVVHKLDNGKGFEYLTPVISDGLLNITVHSLSPFEIVKVTLPVEAVTTDENQEPTDSDINGQPVASDSAATDSKGVKTGDNTNTTGIVFIMVCAVGTLVITNRSRKRKVKKLS